MAHRMIVAAPNAAEAAQHLRENNGREVYTQIATLRDVPVAFLFPGQGSQHLRMGASLHKREPVFAAAINECCEILQPLLDLDPRGPHLCTARSGG